MIETVKTRESVITSMCYTWRHDFGLERTYHGDISCGMTKEERQSLWNQMAQIYDNDIAPVMEFKKPNKKKFFLF